MARLKSWGEETAWCEWIELGGSLGRGAGDAWSDIDAGVGIADDGVSFERRIDEVFNAICGFAEVADSLRQVLGAGEQSFVHLVVQYEDGRQLGLAVLPAAYRSGLPPQATAILDRSGHLATPLPGASYDPDPSQLREWAFIAWVNLGDAYRHALRGRLWRSLRCLTEARDLVWCLDAAARGVPYPGFGAVSVENAGLPALPGLDQTLPAELSLEALVFAVRRLAAILIPLAAPHAVDGISRVVQARLRAELPAPPGLE